MTTEKQIILKSIRGKKNWSPLNCSECGEKSCFTTTYARSNKGKVNLCESCKPVVRARSKGKQKRGKFDVMNLVTGQSVRK